MSEKKEGKSKVIRAWYDTPTAADYKKEHEGSNDWESKCKYAYSALLKYENLKRINLTKTSEEDEATQELIKKFKQ